MFNNQPKVHFRDGRVCCFGKLGGVRGGVFLGKDKKKKSPFPFTNLEECENSLRWECRRADTAS